MSDHRALIEQARAEHVQYNGGKWCWCGHLWPCLTARLADALEQESAICLDWSDRLDEREELLREALAQRDAAKDRAERLAGYAEHKYSCPIMAWFRALDRNGGENSDPQPPCTCGLSAALGLAGEQGGDRG